MSTTDLRGAPGGVLLPRGDTLSIAFTFTNADGIAYTGLSGTFTMVLRVGTSTISLTLDTSQQASGVLTGTLTGTQSATLAEGRTYPMLLVSNAGASNQKTWAATSLTITAQGQGNAGSTTAQTQSVVVVSGTAGVPVTVVAGVTGPQGPTGPQGATGAAGANGTGAVLTVTNTDYSDPTAIYIGGTKITGGAWQVSKFAAGVKTVATQSNNSGVTSISAAWTGRAGLTYA